MSWSARQYRVFETERTRPVRDLLNAIGTAPVGRAVDLGCGPGNSTEVLVERFPGAVVQGLDSSPDMIDAARQRLPGVRFELGDIAGWSGPDRFDVILANAVLQWVPDHPALMPRLAGMLAPGGSLAVQLPDNLEEPAHRLMRRLAGSAPFRAKLSGAADARQPRLAPADYHAMLRPHVARVDLWQTTYFHVLSGGTEAVVEWFKGSGLRPFLAPLQPDEQQAFLAEYRTGLVEAYPPLPDGAVLLPFPRLFIVATR